MSTLDGKTVIITGAAQGIGKGIAERLASEGANVVIADVNGELAHETAGELGEAGYPAIAVQVDVTDREQVKAMVDAAVEEFGQLDVLFNNAGVNRPQRFLDTTEENWHWIMNVNGLGVLIGMQEAAKQMIEQGTGGKIINTASVAGRQGFPNIVPYCVSKFGVIAMTQAAARGLAEHNITVNAFSPGVVDTPLWARLDEIHMEIGDSSKPGEAMENFAADILCGRVATPEDIAGMASFLASSDSDYITGQTLPIDGGQILV